MTEAANPVLREDVEWATRRFVPVLDPILVLSIVLQESSGNPLQINPEPGFADDYGDTVLGYVDSLGDPLASHNARKSIIPWCMSYGLMQILWPVAYERGYRDWPTGLSRRLEGLEWGCRYLRWLIEEKADGDLRTAVAMYNGGPGNPVESYAREVYERYERLR